MLNYTKIEIISNHSPVMGFQGFVVGCSVAVWYQYGSLGGDGRTGGTGILVGGGYVMGFHGGRIGTKLAGAS